MVDIDVSGYIERLFSTAESKGGLEYIYTLVRVDGLHFGSQDPLLALRTTLRRDASQLSDQELLLHYCSLASIEEPLSLMANLFCCSQSGLYEVIPMRRLYLGQFPNIVKPSTIEMTRELSKMAQAAGYSEIGETIGEAYSETILACCSPDAPIARADVEAACQKCRSLLESLLETYFEKRLKYRRAPRFYKLPGFEVLELRVNDDYGLYGFRMHFSNGSSATFARHPDSTECTNVVLSPSINFMAGDLDELRKRQEWRVGEKRLYEIGLSGRYNKRGEWKPLIYPGNPDALIEEARNLSECEDVQGAVFYMMCTGHRVIEFVVRTTIELPTEFISFGEKLHLWKCPLLEDTSRSNQKVCLYDGWIEVDSTAPEDIRAMIEMIGIAINRMSFAYSASADWRLKYKLNEHGGGLAKPLEEDLHILDSLLRNFPMTDDAYILDAAVDWYNHGRSSRNIFTTFLCYYIALESVAVAVADGRADLSLGYHRDNKRERKQRILRCIEDKYARIYTTDPIKFIKESYFDCVESLTTQTRRVVELVFGAEHPYVKALFEKTNDSPSLKDIRAKLAHGGVTLLDREDESLVRNRLNEMGKISKEFLTRVIFFLRPTDRLPSWSQRHSAPHSFADPRTTLFTTTESIFPTADWRIREEWCD